MKQKVKMYSYKYILHINQALRHDTLLLYKADLFSFDVTEAHPLAQPGSPVLQHVGLCELLALAVPEPPLGLHGCDDMDAVQVYLQPLLGFRRDLVLGAPGTTMALRPQPEHKCSF